MFGDVFALVLGGAIGRADRVFFDGGNDFCGR